MEAVRRGVEVTYVGEGEAVFAGFVWCDASFGQGGRNELDVRLFVEGDVFEVGVVFGVIAGIHELLFR
jgi:hypothetical protein